MRADKIIGGLLIIFSAGMYYEADKLPEGTFGTLGADFFPKILFVLLAISGAILIVTAFIQEKKSAPDASKKAPKRFSEVVKETIQTHKNVILSFAIFLGYVILMYYFGYPIATFIFMPILMWTLGPKDKKSIVITAVTTLVVTFAIYYSFLKFLKIFLPTGKLL